jgi:hypothetical protein
MACAAAAPRARMGASTGVVAAEVNTDSGLVSLALPVAAWTPCGGAGPRQLSFPAA